ncbi:tRNA (adenosine(37)-N6)-threonylcarbamoyltransferase complex dimerization subunit type 1 TsaB [Venenivibrio stagnispumantis]|uniref:tRNA threonylcarbamoyladenosine biosynthesis protein TsaB n=1 Tax=Venenivibrio stagnispumantis TaxID=407998 RepID=A0AA45WMX0_9AQUI|nr:tRNA (adenosine(37)-N6)-threonylcarbamoyltransferase complex dimerization subunit type 1 TsaB [Venenivibrio stagnispumantis]MCW4573764.1 tRNA (adenosine(37)-N6)-threonylcarbamoyltransferase complex dimerization subunit type 1 TsaB [Venenivibrio stagnispumantis]SMP15059.1 tRNA threonylcarbamoyladenosine biosynthesis protein TsaB [Venenivibrio stagnispumantis]
MIISIDTFSDNFGITIIKDHKVLANISLLKQKPFSEVLIKEIDRLFKEMEILPQMITKVIVNKGPGSMTGLKVGISVAKSFAYVNNIPLYSYISLDVMAYKYRFFKGRLISAINAGKSQVFFREYITTMTTIIPMHEIKVIKVEDLQKYISDNKLIVTKNLDLEGINIVKILDSLSLDGALYSLKHKTEENIFKLEPLYINNP